MLDSQKIQRRQSEIRQALAELVGKENPTEDETRSMETLDKEYRTNETRYRAALTAEDQERREAGADLETREGKEWSDLIGKFELRQAVLALDEGRNLEGATHEIVSELRSQGGYRGVPIPWQVLEKRAGETVASGVADPISTRPYIDRLFPSSVAARMGGAMVSIDSGQVEYPVTSSSISAGWMANETGNVSGPTQYTAADRALQPNNTLGVQVKLTRKAMKQSGDALEQAVRRDISGAIQSEMDKAVFLGSGASGQPTGIITGAENSPQDYAITVTQASGVTVTWADFRSAVVRFMQENAANSHRDVRLLIRPEVWDALHAIFDNGSGVTQFDKLEANAGAVVITSNALAAPTGSPEACKALLTTTAGGVAPFFIGTWGAIDMIRDPYSDAQAGGLRLTALATLDCTVARGEQLQLLTDVIV